MQKFDDLDMKILSELCKNANISVPRLSKLLSTNTSVLYSRIKRLYKRNLIQKSTIVVNEPLLGINVKAVVGINRDPKLKEEIHTALLKIFQIISISEVTGRFETFVEMQRTEKERVFTT
ncbi:MAG: winged helix-turn-helix transcriptional regulator [Nitrososphaeraceae archaeon]